MTDKERLIAMAGALLINEADKLGVKVKCNRTRTQLKESKSAVADRILAARNKTDEPDQPAEPAEFAEPGLLGQQTDAYQRSNLRHA